MGAAQASSTLVELEGPEYWFRHLVVEVLAAKEVPVVPHAEEAQGPVCEKPVATAAVAVIVEAAVGGWQGYAESVGPAGPVEQGELAEHAVLVKGVEPVGGWHAGVERAAGAVDAGGYGGDLVVADAAISHAEHAGPVVDVERAEVSGDVAEQ